ncbi:hypothetical protein CUMW_250390 [Citrus unshiu]|uniref:Uncharacterized protein n=1 Tax=Citrus unshiu TaxID=55188 RepID=A0A2H5QPV2_CITUN|nr:hypothetical protein CUMW_250390 [Citrus unshiu]
MECIALKVYDYNEFRSTSASRVCSSVELPWPDHVPNLDEFGDGNEDKPESSKRSRGGTVRLEQNNKTKIIEKFVVKYNSLGVRAGEEAIKLSTYIGVLGRTSIIILYND